MDAKVVKNIIEKYGCELKQGYGMTECFGIAQVTGQDLPIHGNKYGSVGRPMDLAQVKVASTYQIGILDLGFVSITIGLVELPIGDRNNIGPSATWRAPSRRVVRSRPDGNERLFE